MWLRFCILRVKRKFFKENNFNPQMIKAKGIKNAVNQQTQMGFLQKLKRKLSNKALKYGLAFSLLFPITRMAAADTIYHKTHNLNFLSPNVIYGEKQNPTTPLEVKVECDKVVEREYEIKLSFFTQDWDKKKNHISDYVLINNAQSNFYLVYPEDTIMLGGPKESAYLLSREHGNEKISGQWEELKPLEESPEIKRKLGLLKGISEITTLIFGGGKVMKVLEEASGLFKDKKDLSENYTIFKVPLYPVSKEISARTFTIPVGIRAKAEKPELSVLLDVGLRRGLTQSEEYGRLENLLVEVPLKADANFQIEKKKFEDNIRNQYSITIFDWDSNKTTLDGGVRAYGYGSGWSWHSGTYKHICVKKGGGELQIPFSKIEGIEFLEKGQKNEENKAKISFWDGNHVEFIYLPQNCESWEGRTPYGNFEIPLEEVRKITFLREVSEPKTEQK